MEWERTFAMIKPDGMKRGLAGEVLRRYEQAGLTLTGVKLVNPARSTAEEHYREHKGKAFFDPLVNLLLSGPCLAICLEGAHAVDVARKINGATEPLKAAPGTIRGDFCHMSYSRSADLGGVISNVIHAADSRENAERELALWFQEGEILPPYDTCLKGLV